MRSTTATMTGALAILFACSEGGRTTIAPPGAQEPPNGNTETGSGLGSSSGTPQAPVPPPCSRDGGTAVLSLPPEYVTHNAILDGDAFFAVVWGDSSTGLEQKIVRVAKTGGSPQTLLALHGQQLLTPLAVDGDNLYYGRMENPAAGCEILRMPKIGGPSTTVVNGVLFGRFDSIAVDGEFIYWGSPSAEETKSGLWRQAKTGGTPERLTTSPVEGIVDRDSDLYLLDSSITRFTKATKEASSLRADASESDAIIALAVDSQDILFMNHPKGQVAKIPIGGGADTVVDTQVEAYGHVGLAANAFYWAHFGNGGEVKTAPRGGGAHSPLAQVSLPRKIFVEETSLFVAGGADICRFPR